MRSTGRQQQSAPQGPGGAVLDGESDRSLIEMARAGNAHAVHELVDRYRGLARYRASSYFLVGGDRDDVVQEALIGLYKAIRDYDPRRGASFRSFAELCITRQILTAIKTATRQKHSPLNTYVSLEGDDGEQDLCVADATESVDPLQRLVVNDNLRRLNDLFDAVLSELESDVLELYVEGRSYQEIAERLGRHVKSVDNAIQRIRDKLERHLPEAVG